MVLHPRNVNFCKFKNCEGSWERTILTCFKKRESLPQCIHGCFLAHQSDVWTWIASRCLDNQQSELTSLDLKLDMHKNRLRNYSKGNSSVSICMYVPLYFFKVVLTIPFITLFKIFYHQFILNMCVSQDTQTWESASRSLFLILYQVNYRLVTLLKFLKPIIFWFLLCGASWLILYSIYSLFLFLKFLLASRLTLFRMKPIVKLI